MGQAALKGAAEAPKTGLRLGVLRAAGPGGMLIVVANPLPEPTLDRVNLEVRFPRRMSVVDVFGRIADEFSAGFDEYEMNFGDLRFHTEGAVRTELIVGSDRVWVQSGDDEEQARDYVDRAVELIAKSTGGLITSFVGARQMMLVPVENVSEAIRIFRSVFFDYTTGEITAFGTEPVEAQFSLAYRVDEGISRIRLSSIYLGPDPAGDSESAKRGALLVDVDRSYDQEVPDWEVGDRLGALLTDGRARAVDFVAQVNESLGLAADAGLKPQPADVDGKGR